MSRTDRYEIGQAAIDGETRSRYPHIVPFQYVTIGGTLYFHFTNYGKKMRMLGAGSNVCVEIEQYEPDMSKYRFVALRRRKEE